MEGPRFVGEEPSHYCPEEDQIILENCHKLSFLQVGQLLGRSRDSVKVRAGKLGVSYRKIAESSPVCKLSNEDIELIRQLNDAGINYRDISRKFECDESHVRRVCIFELRSYLDQADYLASKERQQSAIDVND